MNFENTKTEINTCKTCGKTCYYMNQCSNCQVKKALKYNKQQTWEFQQIMLWGKRLYTIPVNQKVEILSINLWIIDPMNDQYSVHLKIKDGSGQITHIRYKDYMSKTRAEQLINTLKHKQHVTLNGRYWE